MKKREVVRQTVIILHQETKKTIIYCYFWLHQWALQVYPEALRMLYLAAVKLIKALTKKNPTVLTKNANMQICKQIGAKKKIKCYKNSTLNRGKINIITNPKY